MCYDQAQLHFPEIPARDRFIERMELKMDEADSVSWSTPGIDSRVEFLNRMQALANHTDPSIHETQEDEDEILPFDELDNLLAENRRTEAFFLARRMAAEGIDGAIDKVEEIRGML